MEIKLGFEAPQIESDGNKTELPFDEDALHLTQAIKEGGEISKQVGLNLEKALQDRRHRREEDYKHLDNARRHPNGLWKQTEEKWITTRRETINLLSKFGIQVGEDTSYATLGQLIQQYRNLLLAKKLNIQTKEPKEMIKEMQIKLLEKGNENLDAVVNEIDSEVRDTFKSFFRLSEIKPKDSDQEQSMAASIR